MNPIYSHPRFTHACRDQLNLARDANPEIRAAGNLALQWIAANNADKLLYQGLSLSTKPKPVADASGHPSMWLCPTPNGLGNHVAVVMGLDEKGHVRCMASNAIAQPANGTSENLHAPKTIDAFNTLKSTSAQRDLIQLAVNAACTNQLDMVEQVCSESQRFRTMAAFVVVLSADKPLVFMTPLVIYGPAQTDPAQSFTGKVVLP